MPWQPCSCATPCGALIYAVGGNEFGGPAHGHRRQPQQDGGLRDRRAVCGDRWCAAHRLAELGLAGLRRRAGAGSIAAAVIGGASLVGGSGSMIATLVGALTVAVVQNGLNLLAVPASWQEITLGIVIVLAVGLDMWRGALGQLVGRMARRSHAHPEAARQAPSGQA